MPNSKGSAPAPPIPSSPGQVLAAGLAVSARAVGAGAALITDIQRRKCVALWVGSGSVEETCPDMDAVCSAPAGHVSPTALSACFPAGVREAFGFTPAAGWSSEALVVGPLRCRLTLAWREAPQDPPLVDEAAAVVHALLRADRDHEQLGGLESRLLTVSRVALLAKVAAAAGHDFNNLLGRIIGSAELVLDRVAGDAQASEELELLMATAEQGAGVVRRLSALATLPIAAPVLIDVSLLLQDYGSRQTGLRVTTGRVPVLASADPIIVSLILAGLIQDARQRGAQHIELAAASLEGPGGAEITIGDDGQAPPSGSPGALSGRFFTTGSALEADSGPDFLRTAVAENRGGLEYTWGSGTGVVVRLVLPGPVVDS